jgi:hypothetical protein
VSGAVGYPLLVCCKLNTHYMYNLQQLRCCANAQMYSMKFEPADTVFCCLVTHMCSGALQRPLLHLTPTTGISPELLTTRSHSTCMHGEWAAAASQQGLQYCTVVHLLVLLELHVSAHQY